VLDPRRDPRLVEEHQRELSAPREVRMDPLDRHRLPEPRRSERARQEHARHPTGREVEAQLVATDRTIARRVDPLERLRLLVRCESRARRHHHRAHECTAILPPAAGPARQHGRLS
jgi:hypothetical protein